jgi:hypothetical protein
MPLTKRELTISIQNAAGVNGIALPAPATSKSRLREYADDPTGARGSGVGQAYDNQRFISPKSIVDPAHQSLWTIRIGYRSPDSH